MAIKFDKSKLVKNLAQGNVLAPFLDRELDTFDEPWTFDYTEKEHDDAWHPSGDCTPKVTELYAKAQGAERQAISSSLRKSFMVGHFWHQYLQHIILHKLEFCAPEAIERKGRHVWGYGVVNGALFDPHEPKPYHWVTGSGDVAPLETPKWRGIVDIKTMSSHQFKQGVLPAWAAPKYLCQINIYMHLFGEEQGLILAVNKDAPHDFKEFSYTRDDALIEAIYDKWRFVGECLDNDVAPSQEDDERLALTIRSNNAQ